MIDAVKALEHESSVEVKILYTSYTWHLKHWSLLSEYCKNGVTSREFDMADTTSRCRLLLDPHGIVSKTKTCGLLVTFLVPFEFFEMVITVSFVNEDTKRPMKIHESTITKKAPTQQWLNLQPTESTRFFDRYLQNNSLKVLFEIRLLKDIVASPIRTVGWTRVSGDTTEEVNDLHVDNKVRDVEFFIEATGVTLSACKAVLAARSPVFRAMFKSNATLTADGNALPIPGIDDTLFAIFLKYMDTGRIDGIEDVVTELFVVANKYEVRSLVSLCERYMAAHMNDENVVSYLIMAHRQSRAMLEKKAVEHIRKDIHIFAQPAAGALLTEFPALYAQIFGKYIHDKSKQSLACTKQ